MADDSLIETTSPQSKLVGRAQGLYGSACQHQLAIIMSMSFVFIDGPNNGSCIAFLATTGRLFLSVRCLLSATLACSYCLVDMQLLKRIGRILNLRCHC
ncbi:hypothetical protein WN944_029395 [Citrus x changshan-huyou]|uniref:Dirigent protein n=1 Tax=Citrus x changshan-huyou TaxID=2935761 RepID=A0AAP0LLM7_9ROSI